MGKRGRGRKKVFTSTPIRQSEMRKKKKEMGVRGDNLGASFPSSLLCQGTEGGEKPLEGGEGGRGVFFNAFFLYHHHVARSKVGEVEREKSGTFLTRSFRCDRKEKKSRERKGEIASFPAHFSLTTARDLSRGEGRRKYGREKEKREQFRPARLLLAVAL